MSLYRTVPLTDFSIFTTPPDERRKAPWGATWSRTLDDLARELDWLSARDVVLELDVVAGKIRRDGMLKADARVGHPGVRLSFQSPHGAMSFTCDTYLPDWRTNVRAIALTLDRLRAVDRYGATQGQQYAGFAALPSGSGAVAMGGMTTDEAVRIIDDHQPGDWTRHGESGRRAWRRALAATHPDRPEGSREAWDRVEQAGRVLGLDR